MIRFRRIGLHMLFWLSSVLFLAIFLGKESVSVTEAISFVMLLLPVAVMTSYAFMYYLIPNFLFTALYFRFSLYSFFVVILSVYLQMMIVLLSFIFLANYEYSNMIPGTTNAINLAVAMYFVVFLSILVFLVKRWSAKELLDEKEYLLFRSDRKNVRVDLEEVLYIESLDNYVRIITSGQQYMTKERISKMQDRLNGRFLRIHRSFLVNKLKITAFTRESIRVESQELPLSRKYKKEVLEVLEMKYE